MEVGETDSGVEIEGLNVLMKFFLGQILLS